MSRADPLLLSFEGLLLLGGRVGLLLGVGKVVIGFTAHSLAFWLLHKIKEEDGQNVWLAKVEENSFCNNVTPSSPPVTLTAKVMFTFCAPVEWEVVSRRERTGEEGKREKSW